MKSYTYIARDARGSRREGMLAANSPSEAIDILRQRRLTPVSIHETLSRKRTKRKRPQRGRITSADLGAVSWQLSTMLEGGLTITSALEIVAQDTENLRLRHVLQQVATNVSEGRLLSDSFGEFPNVFNHLAHAIVIAGETSGDLGRALRTLAEYYDGRDRIAKKIRSAVAYPIFLLVLIPVIVIGIMAFIVPRFRAIFEDFGGDLPAFTQAFMRFYDVLCGHGLAVVGGLGLVVGIAVALARTNWGHKLLSRLVLGLPLFGKLLSEAFITTFCQTVAVLLEAGVPVLEVFEILRRMTKNDVIAAALVRVRQHITGGSNIALGMAAAGFFPNMVVKMTQVGEESGSLSQILRKTSEHYERRVTSTIDAMTGLLEPVMITTIGGVVLVVVIALYLPIFTISDVAH